MKLVRDRVPAFMLEQGEATKLHRASPEEFASRVQSLVVRSIKEPTAESLADAVEALYELGQRENVGDIQAAGDARTTQFGGYSSGYVIHEPRRSAAADGEVEEVPTPVEQLEGREPPAAPAAVSFGQPAARRR